ncbi:efflux RND transporter periplasmic adaptor subunit [Halobacteriovorax sp. RT-2-4]|uniref:efflux RND transporter periplasmic adaptor subunit n=1 Tax=unclassified Halobacteriovorax TaxID=2639665 RepID=UPI00399BA984
MKQIIFVLIVGLVYAGSLFVKDLDLQRKKGKETATMYTIRAVSGTPVNTTKVTRRAFSNFVIVTGSNIGPRIHASVAPKVANLIKPGALVSIRVKDKKVYGNVVSVDTKADYLSGLHKIIVSFANKKIPTNLYIMNIETHKLENALTIKREAVSERGGSHNVFIVNDKNIVTKRNIEVSDSNEDFYVVKSGLTEGDTIVLSDQRYLNDGEKVNIIKALVDQD